MSRGGEAVLMVNLVGWLVGWLQLLGWSGDFNLALGRAQQDGRLSRYVRALPD